MEAAMESHSRSLAKAISYRLIGSATTALICLLLTGRPGLSAGVGLLDMGAKIGLYFLHERIWNHINFGREKPPEYEI
jgi:uncharacterized membrane protein